MPECRLRRFRRSERRYVLSKALRQGPYTTAFFAKILREFHGVLKASGVSLRRTTALSSSKALAGGNSYRAVLNREAVFSWLCLVCSPYSQSVSVQCVEALSLYIMASKEHTCLDRMTSHWPKHALWISDALFLRKGVICRLVSGTISFL